MVALTRAALLSAAAAASAGAAAALRGEGDDADRSRRRALRDEDEGVEEVGDHIERVFPPTAGADVPVDRRALLNAAAAAPEEDVVDAWPGQDVVGRLVEDEDAVYVAEYRPGDGEMDALEDLMPAAPGDAALDDNGCAEGESAFEISLTTDNYGWETSWTLRNVATNEHVASGPREGTNYDKAATYTEKHCLAPGDYNFRLEDRAGDGICSPNAALFGCGSYRATLNGVLIHDYRDDASNWWEKDFPLTAVKWCEKVRARHAVPRGTCALPGGARGHRVRVTTKADKYGLETSWRLVERTDGGGADVVRMKMAPIVPADGTVSVEECLPPGRYSLRVQDIDGVCCRHGEGYFKLIVNGEELLGGGSFFQSAAHDFQLGFDWLSTMTERDCEWYHAHDYRRRDWHTRCYEGKYCRKAYRRLRWSPALKADAEDYARRLLDTCDTVGIEHDDTDQGENMAKNKGHAATWGKLYPADKITKRFVDNEEFWGWNRNAHLTQALWYPSRYVGCGESVKELSPGRLCRMQVCRFAKAGNCNMGKYDSEHDSNWMIPMMMDDSPCGPMCASGDGCYH